MVVQITGQALFLVTVALVGLILGRCTGIDKSLSCLTVGFLAGLLVGPLGMDTGVRAGNVRELIFYLVLPPLLFHAAWHLSPVLLKRWLAPIMIFATLGVAISIGMTATVLYLSVSHPGFPWAAALLGGTILAATDPVSVVTLLRERRAPGEITTLVEGESLFNDAVAASLFSVFLGYALTTDGAPDFGAAAIDIVLHGIGGVALGLLLGWLVARLLAALKSVSLTPPVLVLSAFGSLYLAQGLLDFSGILCLVTVALVIRSRLNVLSRQFVAETEATWTWLGDTFIALVFTLMGLVIVPAMFVDQWLAMIFAIVAALLARGAAVYICSPLANLWMGERAIPASWNHLLVWGGLRGAIAVALVLAVPVELSFWYTLQSMVFAVVLFNLLVQGPTCKPLIRRLESSPGMP